MSLELCVCISEAIPVIRSADVLNVWLNIFLKLILCALHESDETDSCHVVMAPQQLKEQNSSGYLKQSPSFEFKFDLDRKPAIKPARRMFNFQTVIDFLFSHHS
jgi:hypothetical protein